MRLISKIFVIARSIVSRSSALIESTWRSRLIRNEVKIASSLRIIVNLSLINSSQNRLLFLGLLIVTSSCLPESLPISVEPSESSIAVASLVGPEELILVSLTKSFSTLSAESISDITDDFTEALLIDSALVTLTYAGITDTLESFFDITGLYFTQIETFNEFQLLELEVFDPSTLESASAQSILQPPVEVDSVIIIRRDTSETELSDLYFSFEDPPAQDNFYVMQIYQFTPPDTVNVDSTSGSGLFFGDDNFLIYERIFTDRGVDEDGRIRRDDLMFFNSPIDSALVVLTNIEEGYYNFLEARGRSGSFISSLANEPVNHPSNIRNGVGYFSAHQPRASLIVVRFEDDD